MQMTCPAGNPQRSPNLCSRTVRQVKPARALRTVRPDRTWGTDEEDLSAAGQPHIDPGPIRLATRAAAAYVTAMRFVVTGANRGIGLEFVKQLTARGEEVDATARDPGDDGSRGFGQRRLSAQPERGCLQPAGRDG